MAPFRKEKTYINHACYPCWPCQCPSVHIGSTYTYIHTHTHTHTHTHKHTHTPTLNTGSVIQSVKSIWCVSWSAAWGRTTDREAAKVSMTMKTAAMCTREVREGSDTVKRSMSHCTSWTMGTAAPGSPPPPVCTDVTAPSGWVEERKVDDGNCSYCGPKKLVQFVNKTTFPPLTYKTIAAGRARGSPSSRKKK